MLNKLESLEDESLAVKYLAKFNEATKRHGSLIMNRDEKLSHDEWEQECRISKGKLDQVLKEIQEL